MDSPPQSTWKPIGEYTQKNQQGHLHNSVLGIDTLDTTCHFPWSRSEEMRCSRVSGAKQGDMVEASLCGNNIEISLLFSCSQIRRKSVNILCLCFAEFRKAETMQRKTPLRCQSNRYLPPRLPSQACAPRFQGISTPRPQRQN